ncbi:MAG: hypothetical protein IJ336_05460 [Lachnospiraceae bacterium]|nr:hypothetical protein [Lachnospiraceae bacterium]
MSKNFEDAYREEVQQNIPDLWNRIESSLPEKTPVVAAETMAPEVEAETIASADKRQNTKSNKKTKKNPYAWIKWASLAAAGLLLVILTPTVLGIGIFSLISGSKMSSDMAANESCAEEPQYAADAEENIMYDSDGMDGGFAMDSVTEEAVQEEMAEDVATPESGVQSTPESEGKESVAEQEMGEQESVSAESVYGEMVVEGLKAKVSGIITSSDGIYYRVDLYFEGEDKEIANELFGNDDCYNGDELVVRVYYDITLKPEMLEEYTVTIYRVATESSGAEETYLQYAAELN